MQEALIPSNEKTRIAAVKRLNLLDTEPEERFDRITRIAVKLFHVPISTLTLVDSNREWFKSCYGLPAKEGPRAISFCGHAMLANDVFVIPDAKKDARFSDNPMVVGPPFIRFYAGQALFDAEGNRVGTFCIKDRKPHIVSEDQKSSLRDLAAWAELELNAHQLSHALEARKKAEKKAENALKESERLNKVMVGRELKMLELKKEISDLKKHAK